MKKIVVLGVNFSNEQKARLKKLGDVKSYDSPSSSEKFIKFAKGADVVASDGSFLLENLSKLKNVFVTYPYIELGLFDSEKLRKNGVLVANTQGSNRDSIIEWVVFMTIALFRKFPQVLRTKDEFDFELKESLNGKKALIVGAGSIGTKLGDVLKVFGMKVDFFRRGENLKEKSLDAELIINCLNTSSSSKNLLDGNFFNSLKKGVYFVSFVRRHTYDLDGLIKAIDKGVVKGAAIDTDPEIPGDTQNEFYKKVLSNPKILVTPHIAFSTKQASANGREIALQNIEAFFSGKPKNIIDKK